MATLVRKKDSVIGVIPIRYSSEELLSMLSRKEWYSSDIENKCETRKVERLTIRYLIYLILGEEKEIIYTKEGKPKLADGSFFISISHTKGYVAVVLSKDHEVGIDIEYISPRVSKIKSRFLSAEEETHISGENEIIHLLLHWSAKEALFKVIEPNDIDFKNQFSIQPFRPELHQWSRLEAVETRTIENKSFLVDYLTTKDYVLTVIK